MKCQLPKRGVAVRTFLQRAGYHEWRDPNTRKTSYAKRLGSSHFPKFHIYTTDDEETITIDLHLDQKQASYAGSSMHGGEYDGARVEQELARLQKNYDTLMHAGDDVAKKKSFFGKLFG
jgi:hypothetical protein